MPRTIYTASSAVRISSGSVLRDCWYASSVPAKNPLMVEGVPSRFCTWSMLAVAWLIETLAARLKDTVTEGNTPVWLTARGVVLALPLATVSNGMFVTAVLGLAEFVVLEL